MDALVPIRGIYRIPQVIANCISVVIDGGVGESVTVRHPCVGDPHVHRAHWDIYLGG
jgi:hypothetical protein